MYCVYQACISCNPQRSEEKGLSSKAQVPPERHLMILVLQPSFAPLLMQFVLLKRESALFIYEFLDVFYLLV